MNFTIYLPSFGHTKIPRASDSALTPGEIKQLRKRLGMSIPGFAQKIGVDRTTAWSYESGRSSPSKESSMKIEFIDTKHCIP